MHRSLSTSMGMLEHAHRKLQNALDELEKGDRVAALRELRIVLRFAENERYWLRRTLQEQGTVTPGGKLDITGRQLGIEGVDKALAQEISDEISNLEDRPF